MTRSFAVLMLALLASTALHSQIARERPISPKRALKIGDALFEQAYYYNAIEYYEDALGADQDNRYAMYGAAMSHFRARDYATSLEFFERFVRTRGEKPREIKQIEKQNSRQFNEALFYYGIVLKHNERWQEAIPVFQEFISKYKAGEQQQSRYRRIVNNEISGCELALAYKNDPEKVTIEQLGDQVNKAYSESSPVPIGDSILIFASLRAEELIHLEKSKKSDITSSSQFYLSRMDSSGTFQAPKSLSRTINQEGFLVGNGGFNEDYSRFYFTKCQDYGSEVKCGLYMATFKGGRWGEPEMLNRNINPGKYTSTQPTIKTDQNGAETIYFVSDMPEGEGGMDIWYFTRDAKGSIRGPRNLKAVNTIQDELTPYFDNKERALYFSSNGYPSAGGFDIFRSSLSESLQWSEVVNVGLPINSAADELYFRNINEVRAYFVSNRVGSTPLTSATCCDDIFRLERFKYQFKGTVMRENTEEEIPVEGAAMSLYKIINDTMEVLVSVDTIRNENDLYNLNLDPESNYKLVIDRPGYETKTEMIDTRDLGENKYISKDFYVKKAEFYAGGRIMEKRSDGKEKMLDAEISLYEVDANTGIETLVATKKTNEYNPRYELVMDGDKYYRVNVNKKGYFTKNYNINTFDNNQDIMLEDILMERMIKDKAYKLSNIYYAFGSSQLTPSGQAVLDTLFTLLIDNPDIIIELSAHTDDIGTEAANLRLSQKRAESCVNYLMGKGIAKYRLKPKGYGESKPIALNKKADGSDNPEGRQKNRRTEFSIVGGVDDNIQIQYEDERSAP